MKLRALCLVFMLLLTTGSGAQNLKLLPVDEGAKDASWPRFKARLIDALARRDHQFIRGILDRKIRNMSDTDGAAEFEKLWELQSASSPFWTELTKLLFLGSVFVKRDAKTVELCAPYVYYRWPEAASSDASGAIIAKETLLKARPATNAPTVAVLSYDLVAVADWEVDDEDKTSPQKWVKLKAKAGEGFVPEEHVRSPLEYRACFVNSGARWRMTGLEAGE
jgi:hypothetical protein